MLIFVSMYGNVTMKPQLGYATKNVKKKKKKF
jgi:hypothetical protein